MAYQRKWKEYFKKVTKERYDVDKYTERIFLISLSNLYISLKLLAE